MQTVCHLLQAYLVVYVIIIVMIIGVLSAVDSLTLIEQDSIFLNWTAPFTLDLSGRPGITYCVNVVNSTSSCILHSECGINMTKFSLPIPIDSDCYVYNFTVTPVNQAGNGSAASIPYTRTLACTYVVMHVSYFCNTTVKLADSDHPCMDAGA